MIGLSNKCVLHQEQNNQSNKLIHTSTHHTHALEAEVILDETNLVNNDGY